MGRKPSGRVKREGDEWVARIRMNDGTRPRFTLPVAEFNEPAAFAEFADYQRLAKAGLLERTSAGTPAAAVTFATYADRWLEAREAKGFTSVRVDKSALKIHVTPVLGPMPMRAITSANIRTVVERLDDKIDAEELSAKSASNVWSTMHKLFVDARKSKREALRVIESNPLVDVEGPDAGAERMKCFLFPSEFVAFLECDDVPEDVRAWCAVQAWLTLRPAELLGLDAADIDLTHWSAHVHRTRDLKAPLEDGSTKSERDRHIPIEPTIRPLVAALVKRADGGWLFPELPFRQAHAAIELRRWLTVAGVNRTALHSSDKTRRAMRLYDMRATGATWLAVRGDSTASMQERIGHADYRQTQAYVRQATAFGDAFGQPFPEIPAALVAAIGPEIGHGGRGRSPIAAISNENDGGRDRDRTRISDGAPATIVVQRPENGELPSPVPAEIPPVGPTRSNPRSNSNPRADFASDLAAALQRALADGDTNAARIAMRALGELLGDGAGQPASVVDIKSKRTR